MFKIILIAGLFLLTTFYFMFGHHRSRSLRQTYYLPFCIVMSGFIFLAVKGLPYNDTSIIPTTELTTLNEPFTIDYSPPPTVNYRFTLPIQRSNKPGPHPIINASFY